MNKEICLNWTTLWIWYEITKILSMQWLRYLIDFFFLILKSSKQCHLNSEKERSLSQESLSLKSLSKHSSWNFAIVRLPLLYFRLLRRLNLLLRQRHYSLSKQLRWSLYWNSFVDLCVWVILEILLEALKQCLSFLLMENYYNINNIAAKDFRITEIYDCQSLLQTSSICYLRLTSK